MRDRRKACVLAKGGHLEISDVMLLLIILRIALTLTVEKCLLHFIPVQRDGVINFTS